jgi:hypothetical protein
LWASSSSQPKINSWHAVAVAVAAAVVAAEVVEVAAAGAREASAADMAGVVVTTAVALRVRRHPLQGPLRDRQLRQPDQQRQRPDRLHVRRQVPAQFSGRRLAQSAVLRLVDQRSARHPALSPATCRILGPLVGR